jgi:hypothetical protein
MRCARIGSRRRRILAAGFVVAGWMVLLMPGQAWAQFYVRSPEVEKGELEVEEHGAFYSGPGEDERLDNTHEVEEKYGLTDRFEVIVEQEFEDPRGEDFKLEAVEVGGQYEFVERHGDGIGLAFRTLYEFATLGGEPDEILFGPLGKWVHGPDSFTLNTFFVGQVGDDVEIDSLEGKFFWRLKHEMNERWALGVESFSEIEDLSHAGSFDEQAHRLGPVLYLNLGEEAESAALGEHEYEESEYEQKTEGPEWKLAGGVLFGLSDAVSDVTYKFDIEVEF